MGKPSAPTPPDPAQTASAQTGTNIATAVANSGLNQVNQVTPDGSLTYSQSGSNTFTDPTSGQTYDIPQYTATQTLSENGQQVKDANDQTSLGLANLANEQTSRLSGLLGTPLNLDNEATESRLFDLGRKRLDPMFAENRETLEQNLANRGVQLGSSAYDRAVRGFSEGKNDAYNQLLLDGRGQAVQEAMTERNQPINEITALMSGGQVSQPNFVGTPQSNIATTDYAGLVNSNYNQQQQNYQSELAQRNSLLGGMFGLGAAGIGVL